LPVFIVLVGETGDAGIDRRNLFNAPRLLDGGHRRPGHALVRCSAMMQLPQTPARAEHHRPPHLFVEIPPAWLAPSLFVRRCLAATPATKI